MKALPCRCPTCGRVWAAWPALPSDPLPRHRVPRSTPTPLTRYEWPDGAPMCRATITEGETTRPATVLDAAREYALHAEVLAAGYRYRAEVRRLAMTAPLRGERPGDVRKLITWDDRAAVWAQRAARVRAVVGGDR